MSFPDNNGHPQTSLPRALDKMLRIIVRMLLRNGIAYASFAEQLKQLYVEVASKEFHLQGKPQTISRVSVLTGINRKEVKRLQQEVIEEAPIERHHNRAARVVSGWMTDPAFRDENGDPNLLPMDDSPGSFNTLVKRYSGDMPVKAILEELVRVGVAANHDNQQIELKQKAYIPTLSDNQMLEIMGQSLADLTGTLDHNLNCLGKDAHLQLSVAYNHLPANAVERFRQLSQQESRELLFAMDKHLATQDKVAEDDEQSKYRTGLGIYFFSTRQDPQSKD